MRLQSSPPKPTCAKSSSLASLLKDYARSIGIDCLGISTAAPFTHEETVLRDRQAAGQYSLFATPDISSRCNPQAILPDCRAMVVTALAYPARGRRKTATPNTATVAHYARWTDYHQVLRAKLNLLADFITQRLDYQHSYVINVDNGPALEKAAACRAGIGWFGKNSLLYVTGPGSWIALGVLLTNADLTPDSAGSVPECGTCDLCMRACPTGAIVAPYVLDPRRCLSFVTQMPGQIPLELRKPLGRRIWGCDTCQIVCPWNKDAAVPEHAEWGHAVDLPDLLNLLSITKADFARTFGHTAMAWRGKAAIQRNAAIALGNIGDERAVPALAEHLLHDHKPILRGACAWALGQIGGEPACQALMAAETQEQEPVVRQEIAMALATLRKLGHVICPSTEG